MELPSFIIILPDPFLSGPARSSPSGDLCAADVLLLGSALRLRDFAGCCDTSLFGSMPLLRRGGGARYTHSTLAFAQLEHGSFLSHLTFRLWQTTHENGVSCFDGESVARAPFKELFALLGSIATRYCPSQLGT